ncbi:MAG: TetR/AcrR family transcriptional regulator [Firmicutes bacterium]|nr:TetR/AcrR family transcriptional regulator [Bacillota bacterium]
MLDSRAVAEDLRPALWDDLPEKQIQMLKAALDVFRVRGFHEAKVEDIAVAAGVGKGTIYEYFENKTDLFEQTVKYHLGRFWRQAAEYILAGSDARDKIRRIIESQAAMISGENAITFLVLNDPEPVSVELKHWAWSHRARFIHDALARIIQQGVDEGSLRPVDTCVASCFLFSMLHVMLSTYRISCLEPGAGGTPVESIAGKVMDLLMHGLSA